MNEALQILIEEANPNDVAAVFEEIGDESFTVDIRLAELFKSYLKRYAPLNEKSGAMIACSCGDDGPGSSDPGGIRG